jgi:hypothetical protein
VMEMNHAPDGAGWQEVPTYFLCRSREANYRDRPDRMEGLKGDWRDYRPPVEAVQDAGPEVACKVSVARLVYWQDMKWSQSRFRHRLLRVGKLRRQEVGETWPHAHAG